MNSAKISAVIPTYNRASELRRALRSVLGQTLPVLEIVVVDDGSTDHTGEVVRQIIRECGDGTRIVYLQQENGGKSAALNLALQHVRGEWIAYLDSDDVWLPDKLAHQMRALAKFGPVYGACFTNSRFVNHPNSDSVWMGTTFERSGHALAGEDGTIDEPASLFAGRWRGVYMQTVLVRTDVMAKVGPFDTTLRIQVDRDFLFRLALETPLCYVNRPLVEIDRTPNRAEGLWELHSKQLYRLQHLRRMYQKWLTLAQRPEVRKIVRRQLRGTCSEMTNWHLAHRQDAAARDAVAQALWAQPTLALAAKWLFTRVAPGLIRPLVKDRVTTLPSLSQIP